MRCLRQAGCISFSLMIKTWAEVRKTRSKSELHKRQLYKTPRYLPCNIFLTDCCWDTSVCSKLHVREMLTWMPGEALQALHPVAGWAISCCDIQNTFFPCLSSPTYHTFYFSETWLSWVPSKSCTSLWEKSNTSIFWKTYFSDKGKDCIKFLIPTKSS